MEEQQELLQHSTVRRRLKSWLFSMNYSHEFVRGIAMGFIFVVNTVIVASVMMMKETIQRGELPWYTIDVIIVGVTFLESVVAPVIAWVGWWRRRTAMMAWLVPTAVVAFAFFAIPSVTPSNTTEFCSPGSVFHTPGTNSSSIARLVLLLIMCLVVSLSLTATLCHSIGYMAEHKLEGLFSPFGVLVMARVLAIPLFSKVLQNGLQTWVLVLAVCGPVVLHLVQLLKVPETAPPAEGTLAPTKEGRGLLLSIGRVVSNKVAMTLMVAMAFNAAALWGFAYNEHDIVKAKYLQTYSHAFANNQADILRYHMIVFVVLVIALMYAPPLMSSYASRPVLKVSSILAIILVLIYLVTALLQCDQGIVAGLTASNYRQPNCSLQCGCDPTKNTFAPVCVVEQMTTYLSPCHAGCGSASETGGLKYLSGCICTSVQGRALYGACNESACRDSFELHKILFFTLTLFTVVILQLLGVAVMHAADNRDRSVVVGVMVTVTSFITFVAGHSVFFTIGTYTCLWFEAGSCQMHSPSFSYLIGGLAAVFTLLGAIISIIAYFFFSDNVAKKDATELHERASQVIRESQQ